MAARKISPNQKNLDHPVPFVALQQLRLRNFMLRVSDGPIFARSVPA